MGPTQPSSLAILEMKYCQLGENYRELANRVSGALTDTEPHFKRFRNILLDQRFIPAGRILSSIGTLKNTTAYNCFVAGTITDSFVSDEGNIMQRAHEAAATMRLGGGIGYDFSTLRPRGDVIKKLNSNSTGPVSFMGIFDAVCKCVSSSGHRRGAQMGMLRVDHPDIEEFITAKQNSDRLTGFNLSIAVTDVFMRAVRDGTTFALQWGGQTYREVNAKNLWEKIMRSTWDWGEPGVIFIDRINDANNLKYCETIAATNPCGEQPLPPHGACLLGSFNLVKYLFISKNIPRTFSFNMDQFRDDIEHVVRAMDNVIDRTEYPLPAQREEALAKRRMGLGPMGVANAGEILGLPYGSPAFIEFLTSVLKVLKNETYRASALIAAEKGCFPLYDAVQYAQAPFIQGLDHEVQGLIRTFGLRNSHLTSIAPTGTISFMADNVSSGIEPVYELRALRNVHTPRGLETMETIDYALAKYGVAGRRAEEVSAAEHIAVLVAAQPHVDSAISKTCNVASSMPWDDFKALYMAAWEGGAKGCTTFQVGGGMRGSMMKAAPAEQTTTVLALPAPEEDEPEQPSTIHMAHSYGSSVADAPMLSAFGFSHCTAESCEG